MFSFYFPISLLASVPPIIQFIGLREEVTGEHLKHLRCICVGAAPISEKDIQRILCKTPSGINIIQGYGQTESTIIITQVPYGVENFASVGQPVVNTEMMVIDPENGCPQPSFKPGEICYRGPQMFLGYLNDAKSTKEVMEECGWCHTGDAGYYDDNGYFYIVDRIKELIKVKGFQVAPAELEAILRSHPKVEDAAVTGIPHEKNGEAPVGFIKIKNGEYLSEQDLKSCDIQTN